jgi:hypothetical protein
MIAQAKYSRYDSVVLPQPGIHTHDAALEPDSTGLEAGFEDALKKMSVTP